MTSITAKHNCYFSTDGATKRPFSSLREFCPFRREVSPTASGATTRIFDLSNGNTDYILRFSIQSSINF